MEKTKVNGIDTDATIILLKGLLSGATLEELKDTHDKICTDLSGRTHDLAKLRDATTKLLDKYVSADREIVTDVVRSLLINGERRELPTLDEIVFEETPQYCNFPLLIAALRAQLTGQKDGSSLPQKGGCPVDNLRC